jgi:hypothetical protein
MARKLKLWCEKCKKDTLHETHIINDKEACLCMVCEAPPKKNRMLDPNYIDERDLYSLRADRASEEDRWRIGKPF